MDAKDVEEGVAGAGRVRGLLGGCSGGLSGGRGRRVTLEVVCCSEVVWASCKW